MNFFRMHSGAQLQKKKIGYSKDINFQFNEGIFELADILENQNNFDEILRIISQKTKLLFNADSVYITMVNPRTQHTLKIIQKFGQSSEGENHLLNNSIIGWVLKNEKILYTKNIKNDPRFHSEYHQDSALKSAICAPIRCQAVVLGYLLLIRNQQSNPFSHIYLSWIKKILSIISPYLYNVQKIQKYFESPPPNSVLLEKYKKFGLIGKSDLFVRLLRSLEVAVQNDVRVLIESKSGTGKELVARAIHQLSSRRDKPFIGVDCGAIPENLIESELFGHVKGAFTNAANSRKGLFEEAHGGTLFLDEINNLPQQMQVKLLRVLQEREVRNLGSNLPKKVDVRIIAASCLPLVELVELKQFREDLFYRLHVYPIRIPDLDERAADIPLLAEHFANKFSSQQNKPIKSIHPTVMNFLSRRHWSGNIRELENLIERLVTIAPESSKVLDCSILPPEYLGEWKKLNISEDNCREIISLNKKVAEYEETLIRDALTVNNWNQSQAARSLKISEQTIRYKMKKLHIQKTPVQKFNFKTNQ